MFAFFAAKWLLVADFNTVVIKNCHKHISPHLYNAIIIGSGFGGTMTAHALVNAGLKVLMLERGDWVPRGPQNWAPEASVDLTPFYSMETPYRILAGGNKDIMGAYSCVGGPSVFYGGVSFRFREADFETAPEIIGDAAAVWPYSYADLEPYYTRAEQILNVAGEAASDPTEPFRSAPYPQQLNSLSDTSQMIVTAARGLGLRPFRLPLAINFSCHHQRKPCAACTTCDTFACAIEAKNDLATCVLPNLIAKGLELKTNFVVTRLLSTDRRITAVECFEKSTNEKRIFPAELFILAAGALGSPHLLLASDLARLNPGGQTIGRYLMRHCNAIVFGFFPRPPNPARQFHKQVGIHDFYFGHPSIKNPKGKLGSMQQLQTPPVGLVQAHLPKPFGQLLSPAVEHLTGLLVMAEDQPQHSNHVAIDRSQSDRFGLPQLTITHHYTKRDLAACGALIKKAKQILRRAGAIFFYVHHIKTFSHAVGTVRMGKDPNTSALDEFCQFRGVDNLYVVDGSFMPTSAGLNPSLTISANALRVGEYISHHWR
ncbi:MAG: GMC family oxidoreductase [candidate division KSB1 bacterium]|nr:GMC family oxidoreductase [candidate division KSB1 bacterium]MDZ7364253.1 GMC family oxidoreductase [candidate division KSB1 bacterium]MDZ7404976.1 GMC family oxidoreductase [candidate division KSB1 bacterium]